MKRIKLLITSVGSLVGQNIIEALEYKKFSRRNLVNIIGTNSIVESYNNFCCDKFYLVPETTNSKFIPKLKEIIENEKPDLILSGRDIDTKVVTELIKNSQDLKGLTPYGKLKSVSYGLNKWQTWLFARKHDLPIANTFMIPDSGGLAELDKFISEIGFPLIAKPLEGFASKGVFLIKNRNEAIQYASKSGYILQEYLGGENELANLNIYFEQMKGPAPLFTEAPIVSAYSCQTVIKPNGEFKEFLITKNVHKNGATVALYSAIMPDLEKIAIRFAQAYISEGGYGPFGMQFRKDKYGNWKCQEINLRTNGNTFARLLMGFDEIGLIIKNFLPEFDFPLIGRTDSKEDMVIFKSISCINRKVLYASDLARIDEIAFWEK